MRYGGQPSPGTREVWACLAEARSEVNERRLVRSEGLEPPTPSFEGWCSIQLSYERAATIISHVCRLSAYAAAGRSGETSPTSLR
jgi:hypothetical protein